MKRIPLPRAAALLSTALLTCLSLGFGLTPTADPAAKPLKALLIAGGCCHDYEKQTRILSEGIQERANIRVDVVWTRDTSHDPPFPLFKNPEWAKGYDLIIHDECFALKKDEVELTNILKAHETVPAVHLHCAMHSFRGSENDWAKHVGIKSNKHGPHVPVSIEFVNPDHPITKPFEDWVSGKEELYNNVEVYGAEPLAMGSQTYQSGGKEVTDTAIVIWTNTKFGAPSFSTSLGHFNHNVEDPRYLDLVTRGTLWVCGKLNDPAYLGTAYTGSNLLTEIPATPKDKPETAKATPAVPKPPANARLVNLSAKSTQADRDAWYAMDGDPETRWCGNGPEMPTWLQVELDQPSSLTGAEIEWEIRNDWMQYTIETSSDGTNWVTAFDASANEQGGLRRDAFQAKDVRFVRVNVLKQQRGMWPSLFELRLYGADGEKLPFFPRIPKTAAVPPKPQAAAPVDPYQKEGNIPPRPHRLSPEEEAGVLADVTVPEGFEATLFAPWQMANYPTCVAAAPNGDLYVSSDGNASGDRQPGRGRVLRLRDTDGDGRADEVIEFVRRIDSPRGIVWDHDRLYVLHPPHITVFHDRDSDGVADASQRLISNIAFGFEDRSADHTTNGLEMGVDGWIYVAVGDFGFMKATGADGRTLQMRGGGVVRFRPDGTGLETFADGTRNIYGLAVTPTLGLFARDNTNDGGGWNVRFHHLSGLEDHGYPRLYKNFAGETIAPLADYGGGSGVGAFYLEEPGIPAPWNKAPYTCDWGREGSYRHDVQPKGATFAETGAPQHFIKMTRPTDADVDGMGAVYQASWKGPANFFWKGPEQGYIVRVAPTGFTPEPLPDFAALADADLVALLRSSPSHVRRLNAQRMLLRRPADETTTTALLELAEDGAADLPRRVIALYTLVQHGSLEAAPQLAQDTALRPFVLRALGDLPASPESEQLLRESIATGDPRAQLEAAIAIARLGLTSAADAVASLLGSDDPVIAHTAFRALAQMGAHGAALPFLDSDDPATRQGASRALMRMHRPEVIDALLEKLTTQTDPAKRRTLIATLARLHHREGEWKGDSWSTRPDTRGPYYQPVTWEQSPRILAAFNALLDAPQTPAEEATFLAAIMGKNRIQNDAGLDRILALAEKDASLLPTAISQLAEKDSVPARALPLVLQAARDPKSPPHTLKETVRILLGSDDAGAFPAIMAAAGSLQSNGEAATVRDETRKILLASPRLEIHAQALADHLAVDPGKPSAVWAATGLLKLAEGKSVGPEATAHARAAIGDAWLDRGKKIALMDAAFWTRIPYLNDRIRTAMSDPDSGVASWASRAAGRLGIQKPGADTTPKIATLKPEDALARAVAYEKGNVALGEAVFTRATCSACHTVSEDATPKGPYLGSIAKIYRRPELAEAILDPNKTIAQGFTTNLFTLEDGSAKVGFVTDEAGDTVTIRDISSAQHTFKKSDIAKRDTLPASLMPPGLMQTFSIHELASLLDYLDDLAKQEN